MKYYLDTEFLEGTQKIWFGNTKPTIDLISIGIVAEDGREYYAISKDFNLKEAWNRYEIVKAEHNVGVRIGCLPTHKKVYWIRDNVLKPIFEELTKIDKTYVSRFRYKVIDNFNYKYFKYLINKYGKSNKQIAQEVKEFVNPLNDFYWVDCGWMDENLKIKHNVKDGTNYASPEFYAYYADYDWVVFCWLFGRMIDLPNGFPMYCIDLKQELDKIAYKIYPRFYKRECFDTLEDRLEWLKSLSNYPKQTNEHNALVDARWNKNLHEFINKL